MPKSETIDWHLAETWYDTHSDDFEIATLNLGIPPLLVEFAGRLRPRARVLDAGCGAGRDTRWLLDHRFSVDAFDISREMVEATRANTCGRVQPRRLDFRDYRDPPESWDGIWALASLLHMSRADLRACLPRLFESLTETGKLAFSVKLGQGARMDALGRPMSFYDPEEITEITAAALGPGRVEARIQTAPSSDGETQWINVIAARRAPCVS